MSLQRKLLSDVDEWNNPQRAKVSLPIGGGVGGGIGAATASVVSTAGSQAALFAGAGAGIGAFLVMVVAAALD